MSRTTLAIAALGITAIVAPAILHPAPMLLWNVTASAPVGLYRVRSPGALAVGDWVAARPPAAFASLFAARGYLPMGVPLVKRIAAIAPSRVCRTGARVTIDGSFAAFARADDRWRRSLPVWAGCLRLKPGQVFLLNGAPDSLDSRYFGALSADAVVGRLTPLWTEGKGP